MGRQAHQQQRGFSLLELAIFLAIIGFMVSTAIQFGSNKQGFARQKHSLSKLATLEQAFSSFIKLTGRLPCPADATLAINNANLGNENCGATLIAGPSIHAGTIPVNALNISREFMFDGWDNRFTYIVDARFIDRVGFEATPENTAALTILDGENLGTTRYNNAAMILLSHGPDSHGAWSKNGVRRNAPAAADAAENENADNPHDASFAQTMPTDSFDDLIRPATKSQLLFKANGLYNAKACLEAQLTLMPISNKALPPSSIANYPIEGPVGCEIADPPGFTNEATYQTEPRDLQCIVRQVRLAEEVAKRCIYER